MKELDLYRFCRDVRIITENECEPTETGFIMNGIPVNIRGQIATYKGNVLRFYSLLDLLEHLRFDNVFHGSNEDIYKLTTIERRQSKIDKNRSHAR